MGGRDGRADSALIRKAVDEALYRRGFPGCSAIVEAPL